MLTNRMARWSVATGLVCAVLIAASWFLLIGPRRERAAELRTETVSAQQQNDALRQQIATLKAQLGDLPQRRAELASIKRQLPAKADVPRLVRDLRSLATNSGATLTTLSPGDAQYLDPGTGQALTAGATGSTSPLVAIPMSVVVSGDYFEAALFVKQVQTTMRRAMLISAVSVEAAEASTSSDGTAGASSGSSTGTVDLTLTGQVFVYQDGKAATAVASAAASGAAKAPAAGTNDR
jgi:Tfp pilus assembly protein PilO